MNYNNKEFAEWWNANKERVLFGADFSTEQQNIVYRRIIWAWHASRAALLPAVEELVRKAESAISAVEAAIGKERKA